jgi:ABC-type glutathione transport system ATPase component
MTVPQTPLVLEARGLTVAFDGPGGSVEALRDVSFALRRDEILGIVGETGAGKSLLARALIDLLPEGGRIVQGQALFEGTPLAELDAKARRRLRGGRVALIGTNAKALLDPVRTVGDQIARVLRAHRQVGRREAWQAAVSLLAEVGIVEPERRARAYPHELSGGMAQRVVIAMALVARPAVVLADDATLGLDATVQVQVLDMLVARCRELGLAVVLITHDLGIVSHYADRVAVMRKGRLVELRDVRGFLEAPHDPYSHELLAAAKVRPGLAAPRGETRAASLLEVQDLVKHFPVGGSGEVVRAVDGVSFTVARGETLALVGESGSGKTTVGQCLMRLLDPTGGRILLDGQDVTGLPETAFRPWRRRVQMVFQEPYVALDPRWRVRNLVAEPLRLLEPRPTQAERRRRVEELLAMVHLPARLADSFPHELTAGEQKRVGIARALATSPDFVVFDEPTTALDIRVRAQIIDLVRELQARTGLSALFITHDLNSVRSLAHRVAVMNRGLIVEHGPTAEIFAAPKDPYTMKLLAAELPIEREAAARATTKPAPRAYAGARDGRR